MTGVKSDETVYSEEDGAKILTREEGWKKVNLGRVFKQRDCLAVRGNPIAEQAERGWIQHSQYEACIGCHRQFIQRFERHIEPYRYLGERLLFVNDGAIWIKNWTDDNLLCPPFFKIMPVWFDSCKFVYQDHFFNLKSTTMKNLILFFALIAIGISASAQQKDKKAAKTDVKQAPAQETAPAEKQAPAERVTPTDKQDVQVEKKEMPPQREFVKMADGKVLHVIGMNETEIKEEITIGETKVKPDGTVTMKDGTIQKMKDGNIVNINGKLLDIGAFREKSAQPMTPAQPASPKQPASPQ